MYFAFFTSLKAPFLSIFIALEFLLFRFDKYKTCAMSGSFHCWITPKDPQWDEGSKVSFLRIKFSEIYKRKNSRQTARQNQDPKCMMAWVDSLVFKNKALNKYLSRENKWIYGFWRFQDNDNEAFEGSESSRLWWVKIWMITRVENWIREINRVNATFWIFAELQPEKNTGFICWSREIQKYLTSRMVQEWWELTEV